MSAIRYDRINEEVKKALCEIVRELRDPRISPMTTILSAEVTNDQKLAKIRVSVYDEVEENREATVAALNNASGFMMRELGRRVDIRNIPKLKFTLDNSIEYSVHISKILNDIKSERESREKGVEE